MDAISLKRFSFRRKHRVNGYTPALPEVDTSSWDTLRHIIRQELGALANGAEPDPNPYYAPPELFSNAS